MLGRLQNFLIKAEALDYMPKSYTICCELILYGADDVGVGLGIDSENDYFVIDDVFYDYGPGDHGNSDLNATQELLSLLGLEAWPQ